MRLTADLITSSLTYLSPLKERELDLRGHKIPTIENLAVGGPLDSIDFTDNDITTLSNFPLSPRLTTLLCARNRIQSIDRLISSSCPNLTTLVLTSNLIKELGDLSALSSCSHLTHLSLLENPVTKKEHYRLYILHLLPSLRFLDFTKIKTAERESATELFGTLSEPTDLANKIRGVRSKTFDSNASTVASNGRTGTMSGKAIRTKLSATETARLKELINSKKLTLDDYARIEKDLAEGRIPRGVADGDRMVS